MYVQIIINELPCYSLRAFLLRCPDRLLSSLHRAWPCAISAYVRMWLSCLALGRGWKSHYSFVWLLFRVLFLRPIALRRQKGRPRGQSRPSEEEKEAAGDKKDARCHSHRRGKYSCQGRTKTLPAADICRDRRLPPVRRTAPLISAPSAVIKNGCVT
jgi:hypothetical protein